MKLQKQDEKLLDRINGAIGGKWSSAAQVHVYKWQKGLVASKVTPTSNEKQFNSRSV